MAAEIFADIPGDDAWRAALDQAPDGDRPLTAPELDELLVALGDFVDLKSGFRHGHSRAVAALAAGAGQVMGLPGDDIEPAASRGLRCTTSADWGCPMRSGTSRRRCRRRSWNEFGSIRI